MGLVEEVVETTSTFSGRAGISSETQEPIAGSIATEVATEVDDCASEPAILEEIEVEELAVDGICGVY